MFARTDALKESGHGWPHVGFGRDVLAAMVELGALPWYAAEV